RRPARSTALAVRSPRCRTRGGPRLRPGGRSATRRSCHARARRWLPRTPPWTPHRGGTRTVCDRAGSPRAARTPGSGPRRSAPRRPAQDGAGELPPVASCLLPVEQSFADGALDDLAVARFRDRVPPLEALGNLVAGERPTEPFPQVFRGQRIVGRYAHRDADLAPLLVRHTHHGDFGDAGVQEQALLDLPRVDVRPAGDEHVRRPAGDVHIAFVVDHAEVTGAEPAVAEGRRVRFVVAQISGQHRGPGDTDLALLAGWQCLTVVRLNAHPHSRARIATRAERDTFGRGPVVLLRRQHGDGSGDFTQPVVLHQDVTEHRARVLLVGPV